MIDLHCHILPGADDGAASEEESCLMAQLAAESGVTDIAATPHCNVPGHFRNYVSRELKDRFLTLEKLLRRENSAVRLYTGMEVYVTPEVPRLLRQRKLLTLGGSRDLLVAVGFDESRAFADRMLELIQKEGVITVVAHPERYEFVQQSPAVAARWQAAGCLLQVNKGSLLGRFGPQAQNTAWQLVRRRMAAAVASDAHRPDRRTPWLAEAYEAVAERLGQADARFLFEIGPGAICRGQALPPRQPYKEDRQWESYD